MTINHDNRNQNDKSIILIPSQNIDPIYYELNLHNYQDYLHYLQKITKFKDHRLELVEMPKGIVEILHTTGFTIEKILDSEPSEIAEKLGIDYYVAQIIYQQTQYYCRVNKLNEKHFK